MGKDARPCQPSAPHPCDSGEDFKNKVFLLKLLYYPCVVEQGGKNFPAAFDTCKNMIAHFSGHPGSSLSNARFISFLICNSILV
jgi:hypothetical protein